MGGRPSPGMAAARDFPALPQHGGASRPQNVHEGNSLARTQDGARRRASHALPPIKMAAPGVIPASFPL